MVTCHRRRQWCFGANDAKAAKAATAAEKAPAPSKTDTPSGRKQRLTQKRPRCASAESRLPKLRKRHHLLFVASCPHRLRHWPRRLAAFPAKSAGLPVEPIGAPLEADISSDSASSGETTVKPSLVKNLHAVMLGGGAAGDPDNLPVSTVACPRVDWLVSAG